MKTYKIYKVKESLSDVKNVETWAIYSEHFEQYKNYVLNVPVHHDLRTLLYRVANRQDTPRISNFVLSDSYNYVGEVSTLSYKKILKDYPELFL